MCLWKIRHTHLQFDSRAKWLCSDPDSEIVANKTDRPVHLCNNAITHIVVVNMVLLGPLPAAQSTCADPESFVRGNVFFLFCLFVFYKGREDPSTTISGPSSARQRNAI